MKCPYCNKQMEYGYLYNCNQPLEWIPDGKKPSKIAYTTTDDGVKLNNKFSLFKTGGYNAEMKKKIRVVQLSRDGALRAVTEVV